jgi:pimeloyl-ACP methyl ester carboxylesterase
VDPTASEFAYRTGIAHHDGVELWYDVRGNAGPVVVLLPGAALQAILFEDAFVSSLVDAGYRVIRIDWRDIGRSTWGDFRERPYGLTALAGDVTAVLDAESVVSAAIVGFSMGGLVAQRLAVHHPTRVSSLAFLSSGFAGGVRMGDTPRGQEVLAYLMSKPEPGALAPWLVGQWRLQMGRGLTIDEAEWVARVDLWMERGQNPRCPHLRIPTHERKTADPTADPARLTQALADVRVPTRVLHGDDDGMFTPGNGELIAEAIPGALLTMLPGRGHDLFLDPTGEIADMLLEHLDTNPH